MMRAARELLAVRIPLDAELMVSELLGTWWDQAGRTGRYEVRRRRAEIEEIIGEGLVNYAAQQGSPAALALLSGIACLGTARQAVLAEQAALALMERGVARPGWAEHAGAVEAAQCYVNSDAYGDREEVISVYSYAGQDEHALVVVVDYNAGGMIRDGWVTSQVARLLELCGRDSQADPAAASGATATRGTFTEVPPPNARRLLESALAVTEGTPDPPVSKSFPSYHALIRARIRTLPPVLRPVPAAPSPAAKNPAAARSSHSAAPPAPASPASPAAPAAAAASPSGTRPAPVSPAAASQTPAAAAPASGAPAATGPGDPAGAARPATAAMQPAMLTVPAGMVGPGAARRPTWRKDRRAMLAAEFLASDEAEDLSDLEAAGRCTDLIVDYGCDRDFGRPLRVSPAKAETFLLDWLPRKVMLSAAEQYAMPHVLAAWARWAGARSGMDIASVSKTLDAIFDAMEMFGTAYRDPVSFGLEPTLVNRLLPDRDLEALPRRAFAFPLLKGTYLGRDLAKLDPAKPADRLTLLAADHGSAAAEPSWDDHLRQHAALADLLWRGDPPELWDTAQRLLDQGMPRHDVTHELIEAVRAAGRDENALRLALAELPAGAPGHDGPGPSGPGQPRGRHSR